jgi:hypothetical protein
MKATLSDDADVSLGLTAHRGACENLRAGTEIRQKRLHTLNLVHCGKAAARMGLR